MPRPSPACTCPLLPLQPSLDIFLAFDDLLLLKRGGETIFCGPLGEDAQLLVGYIEAIPGCPKMKQG